MGDLIDTIIIVSIILVSSAFVFLYKAKKIHKDVLNKKKTYRIPTGKITYSDLNIPGKTLFSKRYRIAGKPDYIVKKNNQLIPIELKSGFYPSPQRNHVLQLATYCQLLEDNYRVFVPYGIIVYNNSDYQISFNPRLRFELEATIRKMRVSLKVSLKNGKVELNHNDPGKCRFCSMRNYCKDKLV